MTDTDPGQSLIAWIGQLVCDPGARARLAADPAGVLSEQGLVDLDPTDLQRALVLVAESVGARLDPPTPVPDPPAPPPGTGPTDRPCWPVRDDASRRT